MKILKAFWTVWKRIYIYLLRFYRSNYGILAETRVTMVKKKKKARDFLLLWGSAVRLNLDGTQARATLRYGALASNVFPVISR